MYRKVPSSHWEWMMPWLSPECARGEAVCKLSDVYSFCCLVWETCSEKLPWSGLEPMDISRMWQNESSCNKNMLQLGTSIPLHIASFLNLGLQPKLSDRREMDLQEIYLMLRLQAAAISHTQQKEVCFKSTPLVSGTFGLTSSTPSSNVFSQPQVQSQHGWDAVKERLKKRITPPPPPPPPPPLPPSPISGKILEETLDDINEEHLETP